MRRVDGLEDEEKPRDYQAHEVPLCTEGYCWGRMRSVMVRGPLELLQPSLHKFEPLILLGKSFPAI